MILSVKNLSVSPIYMYMYTVITRSQDSWPHTKIAKTQYTQVLKSRRQCSKNVIEIMPLYAYCIILK